MKEGSEKASTMTGTFHFLSWAKPLWVSYRITHTVFCTSKTINTKFLKMHSAALLL